MARLRHMSIDDPYVVREISSIQMAHETEMEATKGAGVLGVLKEMFLVPSNLYRLYLVTMTQIMSQWSGAGSITLYAPDFFKILGITGQNESLLITAVFGIVKFVAALLCALFLVDVIGRKRALLLGITLQSIAMVYVGGFLTAVPGLGGEDSTAMSRGQKQASYGAIAMIYVSGFGWALGWNSMQYLLTAELFPLRIRALATSWSMTFHFVNQYGNSRAVPNLLLPTSQGGFSPMGTFWFFAAVTIAGGFWVWFSVPETAGRDLESMNRLFELPWYKIGLHGNADAAMRDTVVSEKEDLATEQHGTTAHHEKQPV